MPAPLTCTHWPVSALGSSYQRLRLPEFDCHQSCPSPGLAGAVSEMVAPPPMAPQIVPLLPSNLPMEELNRKCPALFPAGRWAVVPVGVTPAPVGRVWG